MLESVAEIDTFEADVEEYFQMLEKGEYYNDSPFVKRIEQFLVEWLCYSVSPAYISRLQEYMSVFAKAFSEKYSYTGNIFSGRYSGRKMPIGRLASWSPDYNIALMFAFEGKSDEMLYERICFVKDFDEEASKCLIAKKNAKSGNNFYLSLFLDRVIMKYAKDPLILDCVDYYLRNEDEVIAFVDETTEYFVHKDTLVW